MKKQLGGTFLGFIIGLVVGLGAALAVAVYVTKVPIPFINKGQTRSAEQDAAESKKNKDWDPNTPLYGKNPVKPAPPPELTTSAPASAPAPAAQAPASAPRSAAEPKVPAPISPASAPKAELKPAVTADPLGDLAKARAAATEPEPFSYFIQVGAFRTLEDAENQRAKLMLNGVDTKISEREQSGRAVFRVRLGPFNKKEDADKAKAKLDATGLETALVRVQR
jgi:cell division protein FtsN